MKTKLSQISFNGLVMLIIDILCLTFPHYERARVHPQYKAVQEMILGGPTLPFHSAIFLIYIAFLGGSNLAVLLSFFSPDLPFKSDGVFCISPQLLYFPSSWPYRVKL